MWHVLAEHHKAPALSSHSLINVILLFSHLLHRVGSTLQVRCELTDLLTHAFSPLLFIWKEFIFSSLFPFHYPPFFRRSRPFVPPSGAVKVQLSLSALYYLTQGAELGRRKGGQEGKRGEKSMRWCLSVSGKPWVQPRLLEQVLVCPSFFLLRSSKFKTNKFTRNEPLDFIIKWRTSSEVISSEAVWSQLSCSFGKNNLQINEKPHPRTAQPQ